MNIYLKKAAELGDFVLASEESLRLADARAAFEADAAAQYAYTQFQECQRNLQADLKKGLLPPKEHQEALGRLVKMEIELKNKPVVQEYIKAAENYSNLANAVVQMLQTTILPNLNTKSCGGCCRK